MTVIFWPQMVARNFHVSRRIWVKFETGDQHIMLLITSKLREHLYGDS